MIGYKRAGIDFIVLFILYYATTLIWTMKSHDDDFSFFQRIFRKLLWSHRNLWLSIPCLCARTHSTQAIDLYLDFFFIFSITKRSQIKREMHNAHSSFFWFLCSLHWIRDDDFQFLTIFVLKWTIENRKRILCMGN